MGQQQSIPMSKMVHLVLLWWELAPQKPYFWPTPQKRSKKGTRALTWQIARDVRVSLDANVALCFGDVTRVLHLLQADDAELDLQVDPCSAQPTWLHLLPPRHARPLYEDGLIVPITADCQPVAMQQPVPSHGGSQLDHARQICDDSCLQAESLIRVLMPPHSTQWRALPRPRQRTAGGSDRWVLPEVWRDEGLADVVANLDSLQLSGRSKFIRESLNRIITMEGVQLFASADQVRSALGGTVSSFSQKERSSWMHKLADQLSITRSPTSALMQRVTDSINGPPVDFFVMLRAPDDATSIYTGLELVVHVQLPPLYPLARERCRLMTPILHPLVEPALGHTTGQRRSGGLSPTGGRMSFIHRPPPRPNSSDTPPIESLLAQFRATLRDPVECARAFAAEHPEDALEHDMQAWLTQGPEMERRARAMACGRVRWEPALHAACPRAFKIEVRTLMLARLRESEGQLGRLPLEVVWLMIQHLLTAHLASSRRSPSLCLFPEHYERLLNE